MGEADAVGVSVMVGVIDGVGEDIVAVAVGVNVDVGVLVGNRAGLPGLVNHNTKMMIPRITKTTANPDNKNGSSFCRFL